MFYLPYSFLVFRIYQSIYIFLLQLDDFKIKDQISIILFQLDVFDYAKQLVSARPHLIDSVGQYQFIYDALAEVSTMLLAPCQDSFAARPLSFA